MKLVITGISTDNATGKFKMTGITATILCEKLDDQIIREFIRINNIPLSIELPDVGVWELKKEI